jgi:hypothetical protein
VPEAAPLRAGNADREHATRILQQAYADGRLTQEEYTARVASAQTARDLGQFVPLVSDVIVQAQVTPVAASRGRVRNAVLGWLALSTMFILIWVASSAAAGELLYFWPIWSITGTAIPLLLMLARGGDSRGDERQERHDARELRRQERRDDRREARALGRGAGAGQTGDQQASPPVQAPQEYPLYRPDDLR